MPAPDSSMEMARAAKKGWEGWEILSTLSKLLLHGPANCFEHARSTFAGDPLPNRGILATLYRLTLDRLMPLYLERYW